MTPDPIPNLYAWLQVAQDADAATIAAAHQRLRGAFTTGTQWLSEELRQLALQQRQQVDTAFAVLCDAEQRAAYDAARADGTPFVLPAPVASDEDTKPIEPVAIYDYAPLPPARGTERPRGFAELPIKRARPSRVGPALVGAALVAAVVFPAAFGAIALTSTGAPGQVLATPTISPLDSFEPLILEARAATEQAPDDPAVWRTYGNLLYDSAQIVREQAPDSVLYQQRLPRWLEAIEAYRTYLRLKPDDLSVQADLGASSCFYGAGSGDQKYVDDGLNQLNAVKDQVLDNPTVMFYLGICRVSKVPAQTEQAIADWRRVIELVPAESPVAAEATRLIAQYSGSAP